MMINSHFKRAAALVTGASLALAGLAVASIGSVAGAATPSVAPEAMQSAAWDVKFNPNDKESARAAYQKYYKGVEGVKVGWTGSVSGCKAGAPSKAYKDGAVKAINYFRAYNKLPMLTEAKGTNHAQAAALMLQARDDLSHDRDAWTKCATVAGKANFPTDGNGNSGMYEIAIMGNFGGPAAAMYFYIDEDGDTSLGHRDAILDPQARTISIGATSMYGLSHVFGWGPESKAAIAWPPAGFFPYELVYPYGHAMQWSWGKPGFNANGAKVAVTKNGKAVKVTGVLADQMGYSTTINRLQWSMTAGVLTAKPA